MARLFIVVITAFLLTALVGPLRAKAAEGPLYKCSDNKSGPIVTQPVKPTERAI